MILSLYGLLLSSALHAHAALPANNDPAVAEQVQDLQVDFVTREGDVANEKLDETGWNGVVEQGPPLNQSAQNAFSFDDDGEQTMNDASAPVYHATGRAHRGGVSGSACSQTGGLSYYTGRRTANGEAPSANTAAHRTLPFGTHVRVTNLRNNRSVLLRINDRGPFVGGRIIDVSPSAASSLGINGTGMVHISCE